MFPRLIGYCSFVLSVCKMMILERKCTDRAVRLRTALESQLNSTVSRSDVWDKTISFFTVRCKALIFHNGYNKTSREAMRLFPSPAEDVAPLCWSGHMQEDNTHACVCVYKLWSTEHYCSMSRSSSWKTFFTCKKGSKNVKLLFFLKPSGVISLNSEKRVNGIKILSSSMTIYTVILLVL